MRAAAAAAVVVEEVVIEVLLNVVEVDVGLDGAWYWRRGWSCQAPVHGEGGGVRLQASVHGEGGGVRLQAQCMVKVVVSGSRLSAWWG